MVTQTLTYTYVIIKVSGIAENFDVVNENGETFSLLSINNSNSVLNTIEGKYVGEIDGTSIEVTVNNNPLVLRHENLNTIIKELETNDMVVFTYYTNEKSQNILISISKK